ncbi:hypothetical protein CYLTODRAFT_427810, partial [Cylindrobasidium torrendii FP15055 ss-10]
RTPSTFRHLSQSVSFTGLSNPYFERILETITRLEADFARLHPFGSFDKIVPVILPVHGHKTLVANNRIFTENGSASDAIPFSDDEDPSGRLAHTASSFTLPGSTFVHTDSNRVGFNRITFDVDKNKVSSPGTPHMFRAGDIVELSVSLITVPIMPPVTAEQRSSRLAVDKRFKSVLRLNDMWHWDDSFSKEADVTQKTQGPEVMLPTSKAKDGSPTRMLKRRRLA